MRIRLAKAEIQQLATPKNDLILRVLFLRQTVEV